jgi:hypothetical protein
MGQKSEYERKPRQTVKKPIRGNLSERLSATAGQCLKSIPMDYEYEVVIRAWAWTGQVLGNTPTSTGPLPQLRRPTVFI